MGKLLDKINEPNDIKKIDSKDYKILAKEIRQFLVHKISMTGGHLSSNLGASAYHGRRAKDCQADQ